MEKELNNPKTKIKTPEEHIIKGHDEHEQDTLERNLPLFGQMTYFRTLLDNHAFMKLIKKPHWLFPEFCHRKDQSQLTACERERFICAFNMLNANGTLGRLVDIHREMHMQHTNARLLPWHRIFVYLFEEAMHHCHPDVCVPYWDWTKESEQAFPSWLAGILPVVHTAAGTVAVMRSPGTSAALAADVGLTPTAMSKTNYNDFSALINGIHGSVHIWVGGTMSSPMTSPADPVFWLHHANLDRLWWKWYNDAATGNHQNPNLVGADVVMDPWAYTEPDTRNTLTLGYKYV
jgi:hypothetical protein